MKRVGLLGLWFVLASAAACSEQQMATEAPFTPGPAPVDPTNVTWYKDVLPIARQHCQSCHRPDGIAPFSMLSFEPVKPFVDMIGEKVAARLMPPWMPTEECGQYEGERKLSEAERGIIDAWVKGGGKEGNVADAPPGMDAMPQHLASFDVMLQPDTVYTPIGDPNDPKRLDDYHCFVLDPGNATDVDVVGFEIEPGVTREVHHVILFTADKADTDAKDAQTPESGWTCFGGPGVSAKGGLGGWVPGMPPIHFPATTGIRIAAGQRIVMQVHYNLLNGPPAPDRTLVKLLYATTPVAKQALQYPIVDASFAIPTGGAAYTTSKTMTSPVAGRIWGMTPHMHTLGKHIRVEAGGKCLIDIPAWDFHWQQSYFFADNANRPLAAGDKVTLSCTWENNTDQVVRWGEATTDEMCLAFLYTTL